ncbi:MAG TPA: GNAT family N-acetyltransferase [Caulobacteraceae bacterium]|jgi:GNAT superfamily N-acetyltransferase
MSDLTDPKSITLRPATPADARRLTELGRETFAATFGHLYPPEDLAAFQAESHTPERYAEWAENPDFGLWIAERDSQAIGYALVGPCHLPHPEVTPECGELWRIYVRPEAQGSGLGARMMQTALDWLNKPGRALWIGVWSGNHGAQRLYGRHGFSKVGEYEFPVGTVRDHEFILRRDPT